MGMRPPGANGVVVAFVIACALLFVKAMRLGMPLIGSWLIQLARPRHGRDGRHPSPLSSQLLKGVI